MIGNVAVFPSDPSCGAATCRLSEARWSAGRFPGVELLQSRRENRSTGIFLELQWSTFHVPVASANCASCYTQNVFKEVVTCWT